MEEAFLHFIWQFQHLESKELFAHNGSSITILRPGVKNTHAGPDFKDAKIQIGDIIWNGHVEIHVFAKDWQRHGHHQDAAYDNVILHVVWKNDAEVRRIDGTVIPALELQRLVDLHLHDNYKQLIAGTDDILCRKFLPTVPEITRLSMLDRVLTERLKHRSQEIFRQVALTGNDWEEIAWRMLCINFGFKTNQFVSGELGKSVPIKILKKEPDNLVAIEALLFGQGGFLAGRSDDAYFKRLQKEYAFRQKKYHLEPGLDRHQWKFLRLRPANFPTVRIAQLAALVRKQSNIFSFMVDFLSPKDLKQSLTVSQSEYWKDHYDFEKKSKSPMGSLGVASIENIVINTVAPLLFAYGMHRDDENLKNKAVKLLVEISAEKNAIIDKWMSAGMQITSAFDTQGLLELYKNYCLKKGCLNCALGIKIIRK